MFVVAIDCAANGSSRCEVYVVKCFVCGFEYGFKYSLILEYVL